MASLPSVPTADKAATYVRMSTEHQQYSTENQALALEAYASERNLSIVKKFVDAGKSGLTLSTRLALRELLKEVESGTAIFKNILVYDVSRWGRFQDADESAFYEYLCKRAGVSIHYCAEQFPNDGTLSSALLKTIKRAMAAEYSRELSVKVFAGQSRLIEKGYRQGGMAGYGLRRQLIDRDGNIKGVLKDGDRKSIATDRVILIPGPVEEVLIVREIFDRFTIEGQSEKKIALDLNERGIVSHTGAPWNKWTLHQVLTAPKYMGENVYNRQSFKLKKKLIRNPENMWISLSNAFEAIISPAQFKRAQEIKRAHTLRFTEQVLLDQLRLLYRTEGKLSAALIDMAPEMAGVTTFVKHFGSLCGAYTMAGYTLERDYSPRLVREDRKRTCAKHFEDIVNSFLGRGATVRLAGKHRIVINGQITISILISRRLPTASGRDRWIAYLKSHISDITLIVRLKSSDGDILDYYVFSSLDQMPRVLCLTQGNSSALDVYRFDTLDALFKLCGGAGEQHDKSPNSLDRDI